jgi:predicted transglutaminase-like cysteine proteinase
MRNVSMLGSPQDLDVTRAGHLACGYLRTTPSKWLVFLLVLLWPAHGFAMEWPAATAGQQNAPFLVSNVDPAPTVRSQSNSAHLSSREPFALSAFPVTTGEVLAKWRLVEEKINGEAAVLERCRAQQECPPAAQKFLRIVGEGRDRDGLARIGVINRAVNLAIVPMSDMKHWGVSDRWSSPLETLTSGRGDCEDYAIAKYVALVDAGIPKEDVKLVIVRNLAFDEDHAMVATRVDGEWIVLDNRSLALVPDIAIRNVTPLFVLDGTGVKVFVPTAQTRLAADQQHSQTKRSS